MPKLMKLKRQTKGKPARVSSRYGIRYYCRLRKRSWVISTGASSRRNAEFILRVFNDLYERGEVGLGNPILEEREREADRLRLQENLECALLVFAGDLRAGRLRRGRRKPVSETHAKTTISRIRLLIEECGAKHFDDLNVEHINSTLDRMQREGKIKSLRTRRHYETAIKNFTNWGVATERLVRDPLLRLKVTFVGPEDEIHNRIPFTLNQLISIVRVARTGDVCRKLSGMQRAHLYLTCGYTGLRAGEAGAIRKCDFGEGFAFVTVLGCFTKNGKPAQQPIPNFLRQIIADYTCDLNANDFLFPGGWKQDESGKWVTSGWVKGKEAGEMLRHDAAKVGIVIGRAGREANGGAVLDFHSLRHFYTTQCERVGISDGLRLKLTRASCASILARYTHHELRELQAAVEQLPEISWETDAPSV